MENGFEDIDEKGQRRTSARRKADRTIIAQLKRYRRLYQVGQTITSGLRLEQVFETVMEQTNSIMDTERCTVFLHDKKTDQLRSIAATGAVKNEIRIPSDHGIAGWVFRNRKAQTIDSPYEDPRFFPEVDKATGFTTRNILCIPLINRDGECIGALQALNSRSGRFDREDQGMLESVASYVSIALENALLYENLETMNKARERVINHLSHELKTPLAILSAVFDRLVDQLRKMAIANLEKTARRGQRNLVRLLDLQDKIDDILNQRQTFEKKCVLNVIETALSLLEEMEEKSADGEAQLLKQAKSRVESIFETNGEPQEVDIALEGFIHGICDRAEEKMRARDLMIVREIQAGSSVFTDPAMLEKVLSGLLKNAVENTPDEGRVAASCRQDDESANIEIRDFGVGITKANQKLLFTGFIHMQGTESYSSKRPYQFNAGGAGSDLFRAKAFSERFGFEISYESKRCRFIPGDNDLCPGKISDCPHCAKPQDCFDSGGSLFRVRFAKQGGDSA